MKNPITILFIVVYFITTNFVFCQEPVSCGPAPFSSANIPYNNNPVDFAFSRGFVYDGNAYPNFQLSKQRLADCNLTPVGSPVTFAVFPGGATVKRDPDILYVNEQGDAPWNIWSVDTVTGVRTVACTMNGMTFNNVTGITWDPAHQIMYGINTDLTTSQIFSINMSTGLCTPIGTASATCAGAISVSSTSTGTLFCIDIVNDNLYKVNRTTGIFNLVGSLGYDANYGQDAQFDLSDNKFYWAACGGAVQLRVIDTTIGTSAVVCAYSSIQICTIGIFPKLPGGINKDNNDTGVNLYPNPAQNKITINLQGLHTLPGSNLSIYNIQGQIVLQQTLNQNNTDIDISQFQQGVYIAKIKLNDGSIVQKKFVVIK